MLEISLQQEKDSREAQANLLALVAHETRNPIAVIGNTAQMLNALAQAERQEWQPRIEKIIGAVRQLAQLMDNFLAEERLGMKSVGMELQDGDLNTFCAELVGTLAKSHNRVIRYQPYGGDARIAADWQLIGIAIGNLIDNAVKYSPPDGEIVLSVLPGKSSTPCIEVTDRGGVSHPNCSNVFSRSLSAGNMEAVFAEPAWAFTWLTGSPNFTAGMLKFFQSLAKAVHSAYACCNGNGSGSI